MKPMKRLIAILICTLFTLIGCKTVYVPVESVRTEYATQLVRDSTIVRDSVYIRERGDTVFVDRWRTEYRDRIKKDTLVVRDSIPVPYPVEVIRTVEKELSKWKQIQLKLGKAILLGAGGYLLWRLIRRRWKH